MAYKDKIQKAIAYQLGDSEFKDDNTAYDWVDIDTNKSSPIHYLCKHFIHSEENSLQDNVQVATNKALWKIKGFSYTGLPRGAKTLWKEFRKLGFQSNTYVNEIEENLIDFACGGDFENFMINLEEAIRTESIKLIYKSKTSRYGDKSTTFSHVEYPRPLYTLVDNAEHLKIIEHDGIRTPTSFINLSKKKKITTSNDTEVKKGFNLIDFPKKAFKGLVKVGTNISNKRYREKYTNFIRLLCEPVHSNKNKSRKINFYKFKEILISGFTEKVRNCMPIKKIGITK